MGIETFNPTKEIKHSQDETSETSEENKQEQIETVEVQGERYNNELKMLEEERGKLMNKLNKTIKDKKKLREINSKILGLKEKSKDFQGESNETLKEKLVPGEISSENFQDEYDKIMEEYKDGSEARRIYLENIANRMKQEGYEDNILKGKILDKLDKISETSEENKEENKEENEKKEISNEVLGRFNKEFNIDNDDLKKIDGFNELSKGQQFLVAENLNQWLLGEVEVKAIKKLDKQKEKYNYKKKFLSMDMQTLKEAVTFKGTRSLYNQVRLGLFKKNRLKIFASEDIKNLSCKDEDLKKYNEEEKKEKEKEINESKNKVRETLAKIVQITKDKVDNNGLDVEIKHGKLVINYLQKKESEKLGINEKKVTEFNKVALQFSKTPASWGSETHKIVNEKEYNQYIEIKNNYEESRKEISNELHEKYLEKIKRESGDNEESEREAMWKTYEKINNINTQVKLDQFLTANPDAVDKLSKIKNTKIHERVWENMKSEKFVSLLIGGVSRTASKLALGVTAATGAVTALPVALAGGAGFGYWRGRIRGKENIGDKEKELGRKSQKDINLKKEDRKQYLVELDNLQKNKDTKDDKTQARIAELKILLNIDDEKNQKLNRLWELRSEYKKKPDKKIEKEIKKIEKSFLIKIDERNFVDSFSLEEKMSKLIDKAENESDDEKRNKILDRLKIRINYTNKKLKDGLVNFGDSSEIIDNNYKLMLKMTESINCANEYGINFDKNGEIIIKNKELQKRLGYKLDKTEKNITSGQEKSIRKEGLKGLGFGMAGALAGYGVSSGIHHYAEEYGWIGGSEDDIVTKQDSKLSKANKKVMQNLKNLSEEDKKGIMKNGLLGYMENKEQKQFNDTLDSIDSAKIETDKAVTVDNTADKTLTNKLENDKVKTRGYGTKKIEKVYNPVKVEIKGKINTLSEAVEQALKSKNTTVEVKNNFIHKWSGDNINIDENNRSELLNQAIKKMSVANMDNDPNNDVFNLIHKGDVVSIDKDGKIKLNAESGIRAEKVDESQLRENWADIEGAKHDFDKNEVSFGGDENDLGERSYDVDVNGAKVNIDSDGHFKTTVEDEKVSGDISNLANNETAKDVIEKEITNTKAEIEANKIRTKTNTKFNEIIGNSGLTQDNAKKFGIDFTDGLDKTEIAKIKFVIDNDLVNNTEKAKNIFSLSEKTEKTHDDIFEYYEEIKSFKDNPKKVKGVMEFLGKGDKKNALGKIFDYNVNNKNYSFEKGIHKIKNFEKGFDIIVRVKDEKIKFGIDGPFGKWNWSKSGRSWFSRVNADLTRDNILEARKDLAKMTKFSSKEIETSIPDIS